jgi:hypothetical protein
MKVVKGQSFRLISNIYLDELLTPADLAGSAISVMFKAKYSDLDSSALFTKTIGNGVTVTDAANGVCETVVTAQNTNGLSYSKIYYEVRAILSDGTVVRGGVEALELLPNLIVTLP